MKDFGRKLNILRVGQKMSQTTLANLLGINQSTIAYYEKGKLTPGADVIVKVANQFGVSADYLLGRSEKSTEYTKEKGRITKDNEKLHNTGRIRKKYEMMHGTIEPFTDEEIEEAIKYVLFRRDIDG